MQYHESSSRFFYRKLKMMVTSALIVTPMNKIVSFLLFVIFGLCNQAFAQDKFILNLASLGGQKLTQSTLHRFTILNTTNKTELITVKGTIKMRSSRAHLSYQYQASLKPGTNQMHVLARGIQYTFSSPSLEKLFRQHGQLPNGEYEYCVDLFEPGGEGLNALGSDCLYDEYQEMFLINLMEPEDKAKIDELYPMFSWVVNSPLISALTYRIRVAEVKQGQRPSNAIMRNRPVYEQGGLRFLTQTYPVTAKSLKYFQPYAWTVDAFYKDILLGSAETWEFIIINDSLMKGVPRRPSYVEVNRETGQYEVYAIGLLKLKYFENILRSQSLKFELYTKSGKRLKLKPSTWAVTKGENRMDLSFKAAGVMLKHYKQYVLKIKAENKEYNILFKYINPDFIK